MAIPESRLTDILQQSFPNAKIILTDLAGDQDHYALDITCKSFRGLSLIEQHKMVKHALSEVLQEKLHAITIKTKVE